MQTTEELIRYLRAPDQRGVGRVESAESGGPNIERLAQLDAQALTIRAWDSTLVPGNLQTPRYSEAILRAAQPHLSGFELRRRVALKEQRARAFLGRLEGQENPPRVYVAIGERALTHPTGVSEEVHREQLQHLLDVSERQTLSLQVMPDDIRPLADQFTVFALDADHRVGYVETILGSWYSTRLEDVARLHSAFSGIGREAMSRQKTRAFIGEVLDSWRSAKRKSRARTEEGDSSSPRTQGQVTSALESQERPRAPHRTEP